MTRVKVCGLMNIKDVNLCVQAGVHVLGFVVEYPISVPWNLTKTLAKELISNVPPFVSTCVVTGGTVEKVVEVVNETCPNIVQLHYEETLDEVKEIVKKLQPMGIKVIKALRVGSDSKCKFEITNPVLAACELEKAGVSGILLDSYTESRPGGTGITIDLSVFIEVQKRCGLPVILAGGLNPGNIASVVEKVKPFAVDVLTGVEDKPGCKSHDKIVSFMNGLS